ncbi:MAG: hypothetical protein KCHDKBKB_02023 [Elusimicrobia bacterium]|nr:hypothetical protein [Elusimicrobiota bacterium]
MRPAYGFYSPTIMREGPAGHGESIRETNGAAGGGKSSRL